ncbi:MAG: hypothetical protein D6701_05775 [Gemmatimonadetes bacterium]|nr:MAG: hypothetical protein D6701_05775 [Gemmatimonadota bacterium]
MNAIRFVIGAAVLAGALAACEAETTGPLVPPDLEALDAESVVYTLRTVLTRNGVREALVEADTAYFFSDSTVVLLRGRVRLTAYDEESGTLKATVRSQRGRLNTSNNAMVAWGEASLELADGRVVQSPEIHYAPERNQIWSDTTSVLRDADGSVLEGTSFTSDLDFTNLRVQNPRSRGGVIRFE